MNPEAAVGRGAVRPRVTAIGGGHGLSRTLRALTDLPVDITAVVSMADDGGSSGRLRRTYGVPPPGDLRRALSTLVTDPTTRRLLEHRFTGDELGGHALGNLLLLAAAELHGEDLEQGADALGELFATRGRVLPANLDPVELEADLADGAAVHGQERITRTPGVHRVRLDPVDARATPTAVAAVRDADLVVLGPGSLFTSLIPPLLLADLAAALSDTTATTALVANLREQPGETTGMDLADHLDTLFAHLPPDLDLDVLLANSVPRDDIAPGLAPVDGHPRIGRVVVTTLVDRAGGHDVAALARELGALAGVGVDAASDAPGHDGVAGRDDPARDDVRPD